MELKVERLRGLERIQISSLVSKPITKQYNFERTKDFNIRTTHTYIEKFVQDNYKQSVIVKIDQTNEYTITVTLMSTAPSTH
ncbi:hypothetical protein [Providencia phage PSTCR7]|uniref:Uncharacterized protein n=1 Tax=Providencia phage PSTCR7 TaxID=2783549 RepID=A0A7S9SWJ8_9CAUD|nr:hypothetical protein PQD10_gp51 [Providencia phage PSTCR7]QPI18503.1 hypothetical protein [Providencia phage PSTCR7]